MAVAGILLTGGASTRMGFDKATLCLASGQESLAQRTGRLLREVAGPCLEVGPGGSGLPAVEESPPGRGPLAALAWGWEALASGWETPASGWETPAGHGEGRGRLATSAPESVLVVATDLPALTAESLRWLACYPGAASVVPLVQGRPQPLCARWSAGDLDAARILVAQGRRALRDLLAAASPTLVDPDGSGGPGGGAFGDADTPEQARAMGVLLPPRAPA